MTKTHLPRCLAISLAVGVWTACPAPLSAQLAPPPAPSFKAPPEQAQEEVPQPVFKVDPKTPVKDLLPVAPRALPTPTGLAIDLTHIPEIQFQDQAGLARLPSEKRPFSTGPTKQDMQKVWRLYGATLAEDEILAKAKQFADAREKTQGQIATQVDRINFLNHKKTDRFVELLLENRPDLAGLPFAMGDACRLKKEEGQKFATAVAMVQNSLADSNEPKAFWKAFHESRESMERVHTMGPKGERLKNTDGKACVAALMQILPKESAQVRLGLVEQLTKFEACQTDCDEASKALTRLALYSPEEQIRRAANSALLKRSTSPTTDLLLRGLRYPWAAVAQNAAEALVQQQRMDLIPQLVNILDEADPRAPVSQEANGKKVTVVRELVRINHMRNCLLCHPPAHNMNAETGGNDGVVFSAGRNGQARPSKVITGPVPAPGHDLQNDPENGGYGSNQIPDILVRVDVTYLRQDFSLMQKVADASPWPEMQRFDFLVRTRVVNEKEVRSIRTELERQPSPYRQAALYALRQLTGQDAGDTAQAWRDALGAIATR